MAHFIKKTIIIEAVKVADILRQWDCKDTDLPHWVLAAIEADDPELYRDGPSLMVQCSTGENTAPLDGWIIQGVDGEVYPCPADVFEASYEPYDEPDTSLAPHEQRVVAERNELLKRIGNLAAFIDGDKFDAIREASKSNLFDQYLAMNAYCEALDRRINLFKVDSFNSFGFNTALSLLTQGQIVTRAEWKISRAIEFDGQCFYEKTADTRQEANFTAPDVLANDWFIVKGDGGP